MGAATRMKAKKPSKVVKPKVNKKRTTGHTKNHRFQSFNERITKLKIDPVRRRRNAETREELSQDTATYFGRALDEWRDLNLSKTFTAFAREAAPLCDSLPVLLHNEEKLVDLLVKYIEQSDSLSLEPLLDLLSHFAHDLDTRFEKHFPRAVTTITMLASSHSDPAVIEWSFTRLAWLFKYLSRVLTPDLRPLYDLMSPYIGKETQKPFIIRFAAESMSFLIRKAGTTYETNPEPLNLIVSHVLESCQDTAADVSSNLHAQGVMTMFTEAIEGVQRDLHSAGLAVLKSVLDYSLRSVQEEQGSCGEIVVGILTALIHHTDSETFQPIFGAIMDYVDGIATSQHIKSVELTGHLIFAMTTVRKGSRISDWSRVMASIRLLLNRGLDSNDMDAPTRRSILSATAAAYQAATIDTILPALRSLQCTRSGVWKPFFLQFCDLFSRLGRERFQQFVLPEFQKFILEEWESNVDAISLYLPRLAFAESQLSVPGSMQTLLLERFNDMENSSDGEALAAQLAYSSIALSTIRHTRMPQDKAEQLGSILFQTVLRALNDSETHSDFANFALGPCFSGLLDIQQQSAGLSELWPALCEQSLRFVNLPQFWSNIQRYIKISREQSITSMLTATSILEKSVLRALSLPSHEVRQGALEVAQSLYELKTKPTPESILLAIVVESTPISLDTARSISMNLRRLGPAVLSNEEDDFMLRAIPSYCFGVLHFQLSQAWNDAIDTLAQLSKTAVCEETIISIAQEWLEGNVPMSGSDILESLETVLDSASSGFRVDSEFECPNLAKLSAIARQAFSTNGGYASSLDEFRGEIQLIPHVAHNGREQALRVFNKIPTLAEKRSRMLVPVLLRWALSDDVDGQLSTQRWSRKDQKLLLSVFAQFTNPRVLFKSTEVYAALLRLCANGDVEIQQSALKAVFAWKDSAVNTYEVHLNNLLDDARFRDELATFMQGDYEDAFIRVEHQDRLMPVLLRLLYGRAVSGGKQSQSSKRKAIFAAISRYGLSVLEMFINIALGSTANIHFVQNHSANEDAYSQVGMSLRQQYGMLNMMNDLLDTLGTSLEPFAEKILGSILLCSIPASRTLDAATSGDEQSTSLLRSLRQTGLQCIVKVFGSLTDSAFPIYAQVILDELFVPRQMKFATENTQSVSAMLRLFSSFASSPQSGPYLSKHSDILLERTAELLKEHSTKDEVRVFILQDILDALVGKEAVSILTQEHITSFVRSIGEVLKLQPSKAVIDACVASLVNLASLIEDEQDGLQVVEVCADLLSKPQKLVSPSTKAGLLKALSPILDLLNTTTAPALYTSLCGLFSRLHDSETRTLLALVFLKVCKSDSALVKSAQICEDLNSQGDRLDEPDHERRERGFSQILSDGGMFTPQQWQPILQNCLFYLRDDDIVNRTSSSQAVARFIDAASNNVVLQPLILNTILPGVGKGVAHESELVRAEFLNLLGHVVENIPDLSAVNDLKSLIFSGDDEASVFNNVLHIQQHRRLRALRRLTDEAGSISSINITKFFLPLLEHFIFDRAEGDAGRTLADQAISTIGALGGSLSWVSFRATFKRYVGYLSSKVDQEAVIMRLLSALVDGIAQLVMPPGEAASSKKADDIKRDLLPPLLEYIHLKDESTVDRRMPVAITIVKLLLLLPKEDLDVKLAPVLTDVCQILRSHSQEARDQTRKTLAAVLGLVGPSYLGFLLKELRGALKRGSQLHVLSFTVHSLLVGAVESYAPGDLDYCLPELATVIMDDIFGVTGQEKDSEDYRSRLKEVKSSKSFDTMEMLARVTPMQRLARLVQPLRALLSESIDSKALKKADDLLARLRNGVEQNPASQSREALIFCHEILRSVHRDQQNRRQPASASNIKPNRYIIQPEASQKSKRKGGTLVHSFKLAGFALNLLRKVLRRHDDLMTSANIAGFLPLVGDALVEGQEEIQTSAIKLLSTVMKLDLPELSQNAPVYVKEAVRTIKASTTFTGEASKAALDLLTSILREKRSVAVNERDFGAIFKALQTEIDEPDRQGAIYKFLRAVLNRKIMITEVYDIMDNVGRVSVTNADRSVRESARSAYLLFVLEYPHGKDRWNKQAAFLVENLKYEHASGRESVLELVNQLLPKLPSEVLEQLALTLFIALVPVQSSDPEHSCRQMASILIGKLLNQVDSAQMETFQTLLERWATKTDKPEIRLAAFQCWRVALEKVTLSERTLTVIQTNIIRLVKECEVEPPHESYVVLPSTLETMQALVNISPKTAFAMRSSAIWSGMQTLLTVGDASTHETVAKLTEQYFSHLASSSTKLGQGLYGLPLRGLYGLELSSNELRQICESSLQVLIEDAQDVTETLVSQTVRNLVFLGRCFAANQMIWPAARDVFDDEPDANDVGGEKGMSAIQYLLHQLSYIIRQENAPVMSRTAAMQCQIALIKQLDDIPDMAALVRPLYLLTDPAVPKPDDDAHKALVDLARELLDAIQQKSDPGSYVTALGEARNYAKTRRDDRRQKRKISAVSAPEKWAQAKKRKHEASRAKSKSNALIARGQRRGW